LSTVKYEEIVTFAANAKACPVLPEQAGIFSYDEVYLPLSL
jgi:hypothetical protein